MPSGVAYTDSYLISLLQDFYEETSSVDKSSFRDWIDCPHTRTYLDNFGSWGNAIDSANIPHNFKRCPECQAIFPTLGYHWQHNPNHRPEITDRQHEVLTGLVMGDASVVVTETSINPSFCVSMIREEFLVWIDEELNPIGRGVKDGMSAEYIAKSNRETRFSPNADSKNYSDQYNLWTVPHPGLQRYYELYSTGSKRLKEKFDLTPLTLSVWYCCDGDLYINRGKEEMRISVSNLAETPSILEDMFNDIPVDVDFQLREYQGVHKDYPDSWSRRLHFNHNDSVKLWDYMGEPLPGFGYKWPN